MKPTVKQYKGFKILEELDTTAQMPVFKVYTAVEWAYGKGLREYEWEACSEQEAREFIDGAKGEAKHV